MAHSRSTKKRIRQNQKRHTINRHRISRFRNIVKQMEETIQQKDLENITPKLRKTIATIDKSAGFGIIHKNMAARTKSKLMKKVNALQKG